MNTLAFAAVILAGGASRRMRADKALLCLPSGGLTLIERTVAAARAAGASEVVIVRRAGQRLPTMDGVCTLEDETPGAGPLAGLATGLAATKHDVVLALACDLPYLSVPLLRWMVTQKRDEWDALVPHLPTDENSVGWEPLHALYTHACLPAICAALARGERRMTAPFAHLRVRPLTAEEMRPHDPALRSTHSVNIPEAWVEATHWLLTRNTAILPPVD